MIDFRKEDFFYNRLSLKSISEKSVTTRLHGATTQEAAIFIITVRKGDDEGISLHWCVGPCVSMSVNILRFSYKWKSAHIKAQETVSIAREFHSRWVIDNSRFVSLIKQHTPIISYANTIVKHTFVLNRLLDAMFHYNSVTSLGISVTMFAT
jgi:hypothetical protein